MIAYTMDDLRTFYRRMHSPGTVCQVSTLTTVVAYNGDSLEDILLNHEHDDLYFLAGIDPIKKSNTPHPRHIADSDIVKKRYVFFDFDIRKDLASLGQTVTDDDIRWIGAEFITRLAGHPILSTWSYLVFTGNGLHLYYCGEDFPINKEAYRLAYDDWARRLSNLLTYTADPACKNPARIARMPGSWNNKNGQHKQVQILAIGDPNPSPLVQHILTATMPMKMVTTKDVIDWVHKTPIRECLTRLGHTINDDGYILHPNGEKSSMKVNDQLNYINRFSNKPGSGDLLKFLMGTENLTFHDAVSKVATTLMGAHITVSPERKEALTITRTKKPLDLFDTYLKPQPLNNKTWGLPHLDELFDRPRHGDFILFLGEAGVGKTSMAIYSACVNAKKGVKTLFLSFEMSKENLLTRYIDTRAQITEDQKVHAKYDPDQISCMKEIIAELNSDYLTWLDMKDVSDPKNWDLVKALMEDYDMIFIDNFSRIVPRTQDETITQSHISENLSNYVEASGKTVVLIHHYAKRVGTTQRGLEARGSQKLIDDISIHVSISRDVMMANYEEGANFMDFSIRKNRYGKTGTAQIRWDNGKYY